MHKYPQMCMAAKVPKAVEIATQAIQDGKCVVIGLQVRMYVCVDVYVLIHVACPVAKQVTHEGNDDETWHTCIHTYTHTYTYTYIHTCHPCLSTNTYIHVHLHTHMSECPMA